MVGLLPLLLTGAAGAGAVKLGVEVESDGKYSVLLDGDMWLHSSPVRAYFSHTEYPAPARVGGMAASAGTDELGHFTSKTQKWLAGSVGFSTAVKLYAARPDIAIFETSVPAGTTGTNASVPVVPGGWPGSQGNVKPIIAFPAFATDSAAAGDGSPGSFGLAALDQLRWEDNFCYYSHGPALTLNGNKSKSMLGQGMYGGPVVLHDRKNLTGQAAGAAGLSVLLLAPLDHVKHHGSYRNDTLNSAWELGVYSQVTSLPAGFTHRTLALAGEGVTATVAKYGALAMELAGTNRTAAMAKDVVVNYLGYWTDSGAYYYADIPFKHNLTAMAETAGVGMTMEDVSVKVKTTLDAQKVPIKYWQWDDWWYPGHAVYVWCVEEWEMVDYAFPSGLAGMHSQLGVPFLYYMPYWCMDNHTTNTPSGSKWSFLTPADCGWECEYTFVRAEQSEAFHLELFNTYTGPLGMSNYEQDFMVTNFLKTNLYRTNLTEYIGWAAGLNSAAEQAEIPVQFCMAMPSDIMMSVELDWVTNARASDDYAGGSDNLLSMPHAALLMWSLGIRPSKDNFWTTNVTDNPYQKGSQTPKNPGSNLELNTIAAVLSTGPVGISDKINATNATLIMATCDANGRLLQPSKPLTPSDRMYTQIGQSGFCPTCRGQLPQTGSNGELWSTFSTVGPSTVWMTVGLRIGCDGKPNCDAAAPLALEPIDLYPPPAAGWAGLTLLHREWHSPCIDGADAVASGCIVAGAWPDLRSTNRSKGTGDFPFDYFTSQDGAGEWVLLGELSKYTTVSAQRFTALANGAAGLELSLAGAAGEEVTVTALHKAAKATGFAETDAGLAFKVVVKAATIGADGTAKLHFS